VDAGAAGEDDTVVVAVTVTVGSGVALFGKNMLLVAPAAWPIRPATRAATMPPTAPMEATRMSECDLECLVLLGEPLSLAIPLPIYERSLYAEIRIARKSRNGLSP
jgi:hypothetical protein